MVADAGNLIYSKIVRALFVRADMSTGNDPDRAAVDNIRSFNGEHLADLIEAALAAADSCAAAELGVPRTWSTMVGGSCGAGDDVTKFLRRAVKWEVLQKGQCGLA